MISCSFIKGWYNTWNVLILSIIFSVPGDGGNQLRASLNLSEASHIYCTKHSQEFTLWLDLEELLPFFIECFTENIRYELLSSPGTSNDMPDYKNKGEKKLVSLSLIEQHLFENKNKYVYRNKSVTEISDSCAQ